MDRQELTDIVLQSVSHAASFAAGSDGKCVQKYKRERGFLERFLNYRLKGDDEQCAQKYMQLIGQYYAHHSEGNNFRCRRDLHKIKNYMVHTISNEIDYGLQSSLRHLLKWVRPLYIVPALTLISWLTPLDMGYMAKFWAVLSVAPIAGLEIANLHLKRTFKKKGKETCTEQDEERKKLVLMRKAIKSVPISEFGEVLQANKSAIRPYISMQ